MKKENIIYKDKVAVITGAASGIGLGFANRCANKGMKIVLADIEKRPLFEVEKILSSRQIEVIAQVTDVGNEADMKKLAEVAFDTYGEVHFLFNNAGVGLGGTAWDVSVEQWKWIIDVNLMGVIYGLKYFIPRMINQNNDCFVINTSSLAGLTTGARLAPYIVTKHAVVSLTESTFHDLRLRDSKVKTAVFCPVIVDTNIMSSLRNAPLAIRNYVNTRRTNEEREMEEQMSQILKSGMTIEQAADCLFDGLEAGKFYILTHQNCKTMIETRFTDIFQDRLPTIPSIPNG